MNAYKIEVRPNGFFIPSTCVLCGNGYEPSDVRYTLHIEGFYEGDVCDVCARATPEKVATRARACADEHLEMSRELMHKAEIVIQEFSADVFPTDEQIARAEREGMEAHTSADVKRAEVEGLRQLYPAGWDDEWQPTGELPAKPQNTTEEQVTRLLGAQLDAMVDDGFPF